MRTFLIGVTTLAAGGPAAAATLLGNAQCRATTEPSSQVVQQLWGGDTVRIIDRTTGWVKINRGERGCWVSVGLVGEGSSVAPPVVDRGAVLDACRCRKGKCYRTAVVDGRTSRIRCPRNRYRRD